MSGNETRLDKISSFSHFDNFHSIFKYIYRIETTYKEGEGVSENLSTSSVHIAHISRRSNECR